MASWYVREKSPYIWIKYFDPQKGKYAYQSTNSFVRPNGMVTPCIKGSRDAERKAKLICDEIEAAKRLNLVSSYFTPQRKSISIGTAFSYFKDINLAKDKSTQKNYELFFNLFKKTFAENNPCDSINKKTIELWLASLKKLKTISGNPYSQNYIYNFQKNLKKFLLYLFDNKYLEPFKISKDVQVSIEVREKIIFKPGHIHLIMDNLLKTNSNFTTCIYLLLYTGLRTTDILTIKAENIDLSNKSYQYYSPKLKKYITVPIHPALFNILKKRLLEIEKGPLVQYSHHHAVQHAFKRYLASLEIDKFGYSPRTFRKSFDTWAYQSGMNTIANSRLVGHNITTAEKNYREVYLDTLQMELSKFTLPAKPPKTKRKNG